MRRRFAEDLVPHNQPFGELSDAGRSAEALAADRAHMDRLIELLPDDRLRAAVDSTLRERYAVELGGALGDPLAIARLVDEISPEPLAPSADEIQAELSQAWAPPASLVEEEVKTAREELVRHWVNLCLMAAEEWEGLAASIPLAGESLEPGRPEAGDERLLRAWQRWAEARRQSLEDLAANVALGREEIEELMRGFATRLRAHLEGEAVPIPDHMEVALSDGKPILRTRGAD
jgi:hypothetical protein